MGGEEKKANSFDGATQVRVEKLIVGPVQTCCYLVSMEESDACVIIDPGAEPKRIRRALGKKSIQAILLTHGHFDHIGGVAELMSPDTELIIHALDAPMLSDPRKNASLVFGLGGVTAPAATRTVEEGDPLEYAGLSIRVLHTPGHTPGSVCYAIGEHLFTGDTLFHHGWGRTDLPGGDEDALWASLRRLMPLRETHGIYPGHD